MGHNSMVLGHPKFTGNPQVDGLSTGPPDLRRHSLVSELRSPRSSGGGIHQCYRILDLHS